MGKVTALLIIAMIGLIVGVTLISPISTAIGNANLTGTNKTLADLIPTLFVVALVGIPIGILAFTFRGG